jgi:hypothetical protein
VYQGNFSNLKRPGRKAGHIHPSNGKVKNEWSYTSTPPIGFNDMGRDGFIFNNTSAALDEAVYRGIRDASGSKMETVQFYCY